MYYGQFYLDKYLHENFFLNKENGFFVECGALDGLLETTCKFFEDSLKWNGINIEPVPPLFKMLKKNRPNCNNINVALSNEEKKDQFTHVIHPKLGVRFGNGSLKHHKNHMNSLIKQGCSFEKYNTQCKKFSQIFDNPKEIDLFVLDVEGHEFQALQGILELPVKYLPKIFCIEYTFTGLDKISNRLKDIYNLHSKYHHNAIFVKK